MAHVGNLHPQQEVARPIGRGGEHLPLPVIARIAAPLGGLVPAGGHDQAAAIGGAEDACGWFAEIK
jgi:hypothetical protein